MLVDFLKKRGIDLCNTDEVLHELYREGLISTNIYYYQELYLFMKELYKTGAKNKEVVLTTMEHFEISRQTCFNVWNKMKKLEEGS